MNYDYPYENDGDTLAQRLEARCRFYRRCCDANALPTHLIYEEQIYEQDI